jgi:hypothetical protein
VELVKMVARMLPHNIDWEIANDQLDISDPHKGRWCCDLKSIGRVDENLVARLDRNALEALGLTTKEPENGLVN